ncbi:MAG: Amuc_1100 family pilus-like protein [Akkermansiaceae bacterium]
MSWIQENKFVAGVAGVTAVLGGAIFFFGNSKGNEFDATMKAYNAAASNNRSMERSNPYPNAANLAAKKRGVEEYESLIKDVRATLVGFGPGKLEQLSPQQFSDARTKVHNDESRPGTKLAEGCYFGFSKYSADIPKASATAELNYQLNATHWLLGKLAEVKPAELNNIHRELLAVEKPAPAPTPAKKKGKKCKKIEKAYTLMPMELTFTANEKAVRDFLQEMVNSKEYFYAIRAIRVRNDKQTAPNVSDVNFPADGGGEGAGANEDDPFGGIALPDDEPADGDGGDEDAPPAAPVIKPKTSERILEQVLGSEKLNVHICFDVVLVKPIAPDASSPAPSSPAAPAAK